jgi:hypothetical protein
MSAFQRGEALNDMRYLFARDFLDVVNRGRDYDAAYAAAVEMVPTNSYSVARDFDADSREREELAQLDFPTRDALSELADTYGTPSSTSEARRWANRAAQEAPRARVSTPRATQRSPRTPTAIRERAMEGQHFKFDLPPSKATKVDFQKKYPEGVSCMKLPQEGGPLNYKICASTSEINGAREITMFDVEAIDRKSEKVAGYVSAVIKSFGDKRTYKVGASSVVNIDYTERDKPPEERKPGGLGTRMYERALRAVCSVGNAYAITSDTTRSEFSEAFWQKQVAKGRARCVGDGTQSRYFRTPILEAEEQYAVYEGKKNKLPDPLYDGPLFEKYKAGLPSPQYDPSIEGGVSRWSCDYFEMLCKDRPDSLDGLRIKSFTKSKRRKR